MKKYLKITAALLVAISMFMTSCEDDDDDDDDAVEDENVVSGEITENTTWASGETYILGGRVTVTDGVTLTIESGVVIKGEAGTGANATALLVARGGKLMAQGTEDSPVIFTSEADDIEPGQLTSPEELDPSLNGLWGGVIVLGYAPSSTDEVPFQIEGIPASDQNGLYGGDVADDASGTIQYISIRHGGSNIGEGNEINGLTLGGVGTGTTIDHIEVVANQDDGIECFGGTVNVSDVLIWNQGDDAFDMDQDYTGTIDNFIGIMGDESDHGMELDGPEGDQDNGGFTLTNGSIKGWNDEGEGGGEYADLRDAVKCEISNVYFFNFSDDSDFEIDEDGGSENYTNGDITITGLEFNVSHLEEGNMTIADIMQDKSDIGTAFDGLTDANAKVITSTPSVGANKAEFTGWTWADAAGELADF
ncbi:MAG: hypothetical protein GVY19_04740 [Bacteroidetes bacterium]|jgi:hypothetical protein|nr:hypothetical protein [Bacteroidota bacterium]